MKNVDAFGETSDIEDPVRRTHLDSDFPDAGSHTGQGLPVRWLKALLHPQQLKTRRSSGANRERPDIASGRTEPEEGLLHLATLYKYQYARQDLSKRVA
jgi:hypothetical protein